MPRPRYFSAHATNGGDSPDVTSADPHDYVIGPPPGEVWEVGRVIVSFKDTAGGTSEEYGDGAALTNGMEILVLQDGLEITLTPHPVTTSAEWSYYTYDMKKIDFGVGQVNETIVVRWTFREAGAPIRLEGNAGDKIIVRAQDDLSHLLSHHYLFQGVIENVLD